MGGQEQSGNETPLLSVVIPALDAAATLPGVLAALRDPLASSGAPPGLRAEVVVADGGSADGTAEAARAGGARVVEAPRGRGVQLAAGVAAARGAWLLLLHADTRPGAGWAGEVAGFAAAPGNAGRAAYFRFGLDDDAPAARRLERAVAWRCRVLGLPYGDQGLLVSRALLARVGGVRPLPIMEDVDLVRRLGRGRLAGLETRAETSAERWRREGYGRRSARNLACLLLWRAGVPPAVIRGLYA